MTEATFTCKCIACGKKFEMTEQQLQDASDIGCAISPCCGFPSTVDRVAIKQEKAS